MTAMLPIAKAEPFALTPWRAHLGGLGAAWTAILLLFRSDAAGIVTQWVQSATFNHCFFILPLIGWLVWLRLPELRQLKPAAWAPGLLLVGAGAFAWLLGDAGGVALARHFGLVAMLQGAVVACLGKAAVRGLAFPIFYAFFLVPAGEEIVPLMQTVTAKMCMVLLDLAGVPAHIDGIFITIPGGYFKVAEACSGVMFLVAMLAYAALVANVCFRSWRRRIPFMIVAATIPILANGLRAWGTIYISWLSGSTAFAEGFDHIFYGWIFFGIVIALVMAAGWRFFDRKVDDPWFDPRDLQPQGAQAGSNRRLAAIAASAIAVAALPLLWSSAIASAGTATAPSDFALPEVPGWTRSASRATRPWQPHFAGADFVRLGHYRDSEGHEVDLAVASFARQREGAELVGFGQGAVAPHGDWSWASDAAAPPNGRAEIISSRRVARHVVSFYRVGSITTGSAAAVKLETVKARLLGGPQRAVAILVSAEVPADGSDPGPSIQSFLSSLGPVDGLADRAGGLPQAR